MEELNHGSIAAIFDYRIASHREAMSNRGVISFWSKRDQITVFRIRSLLKDAIGDLNDTAFGKVEIAAVFSIERSNRA